MAQELDIVRWDLECEFNSAAHRTELAGQRRLVVRRGQAFSISLSLRPGTLPPPGATLSLVAETGPQPSDQYGTRASFGLSDHIDETSWSAALTSPPGDTVTLAICSAPNAPVGRYSLALGGAGRFDFILLFNPWCQADSVYMDSEEELQEYVLAQDGIIFRGSYKHPITTPWNYGQFEEGILDACLRILDMNPKHLRNPGKDCSGRRNPVYLTRVLSAMVNCNDDRGVLLGRWTDDYDGGVSPMSWSGSVDILLHWSRHACQPVRYGQCWVFAAVACTVARALGIPCRVVTNYLSAHDTNSNLAVERHVDEEGRSLPLSKDTIWNYHCWVESWMTRPDLKTDGWDGWQASDPTPQEKSQGVYCCGPVPLKAIKEGELTFRYDAPFVFAEVNADVQYFLKRRDGSTEQIPSSSGSALVGQKISTKGLGSDRRQDITHLYKYPEGSAEEREAFQKANHQNKLLQQQQSEGLHLAIKVVSEMRKGCDFDVLAVATNHSSEEKRCRLLFGSRAVSYNGTLGDNCGFKDLLNVELEPGGERSVPLRLNYSRYGAALTQDNMVRLVALLLVPGTHEAVYTARTVVLDNPDITVRILGEPKVNRRLAAEITLQNPLPVAIDDCCFSMEGANLTGGRTLTERLAGRVGPGEEARVKMYFTPSRRGLRKLVVDFTSDKLCHVKGYRNVIIGQ